MQIGRLPSAFAQTSLTVNARVVEAGGKTIATAQAPFSTLPHLHARYTPKHGNERLSKRARAIDQDFFLSVLGASATRRDAKDYLSRFAPPNSSGRRSTTQTGGVTPYARGVNLGALYSSPRAVAQAPIFSQDQIPEPVLEPDPKVHVAIVVLRRPQYLTDNELNGVALTLGQLARLGLPSAVVLDLDDTAGNIADYQSWHQDIMNQAQRLATAIRHARKSAAQVLDQALSVSAEPKAAPASSLNLHGPVTVKYDVLLLTALQNGIVTIVPPIAYNRSEQAERVLADDVVLAVARTLCGVEIKDLMSQDNKSTSRQVQDLAFSLDRVILLDPAGGLPATESKDNAHIFVNLDQEYSTIRKHLIDTHTFTESNYQLTTSRQTPLHTSDTFSGIGKGEASIRGSNAATDNQILTSSPHNTSKSHLKNLDLLQQTLKLLPPASSGLVIRPQDVASAALTSQQRSGVGTRQYRNPLIHNLLTDRPIISSSLPSGRFRSGSRSRFSPQSDHTSETDSPHATFFKRGMPVTIIPDLATSPWSPPEQKGTSLTFDDPRIDFSRLLHLIEDSFGRKLDVNHYLSRIQNHLAGIIIAGEYEGGAILTWEYPSTSDGSRRPPVPYLDKFAVLQRSQGAGGVADVVFNAMVRTCFPDGVVWRSRKNNPVNRWYFERADGTWKIPGTQWTMFWTGDELWSGGSVLDGEEWKKERWKDYVDVCQNIGASWADNKAPD